MSSNIAYIHVTTVANTMSACFSKSYLGNDKTVAPFVKSMLYRGTNNSGPTYGISCPKLPVSEQIWPLTVAAFLEPVTTN